MYEISRGTYGYSVEEDGIHKNEGSMGCYWVGLVLQRLSVLVMSKYMAGLAEVVTVVIDRGRN